jgi:amino acid adenylation domain-containing protein
MSKHVVELVQVNAEERSKHVVELFQEVASTSGALTALTLEDGRSFTYSQIDQLSGDLSRAISEVLAHTGGSDAILGGEPAESAAAEGEGEADVQLVASMLERDAGFIVSMLAILKAGICYVPIDPTFPPDRQSYIMAQSKCRLMITSPAMLAQAKSLNVDLPPKVIVINEATGEVIERPAGPQDPTRSLALPPPPPSPSPRDSLAYVLFTSGSTGKPKGVMVYNKGLANIIEYFSNLLDIGHKSRVLCLTSVSFDIIFLELFTALTRGGTLVLANSTTQKDAFRLIEFMQESKVTVVQATPTTYEMMLATGWKGDKSVDFIVGGEACRRSVLPLSRCCHSLNNAYGPTETTVWSSVFTIGSDFPLDPHDIPIGGPISKTDFLIVDITDKSPTYLQPFPEALREGETADVESEGELWIGGEGVTKGYLYAPDLTAKVFLPNPFGSGPCYRTGDLVRRTVHVDGRPPSFVFVRRLDDQVKIGGYRIELQEIENVYSAQPEVEQAVAIVRQNVLVIYLKAAEGHTLSSDMLVSVRAVCAQSLTHYMMPKYTVVVTDFPRTPNQKLDRKKLPDPIELTETEESVSDVMASATDAAAESYSAGHHRLTSIICDIVALLRGRRPMSNASFAAIGVDSLGAVMLLRQLSETLGGMKITFPEMFTSGYSINSFATHMLARIKAERPKLMETLHLRDTDIEMGYTREPDDLDLNKLNATTLADLDFEQQILSNQMFVEGFRGLLTILIFIDHFLGVAMNPALIVDTALFVIMSGFTVGLQLKTPLQYVRSVPKDQTSAIVVAARKPFAWRSFLSSRAVGIFPILWLVILLAIPDMVGKTLYSSLGDTTPEATKAGCAVLYVVGLQTWWVPTCRHWGPNYSNFASVLWSVFLLYTIARFVMDRAQNKIMSIAPVTNKMMTEPNMFTFDNPKMWFHTVVTRLAYNRVNHKRHATVLTFCWLAVLVPVMQYSGNKVIIVLTYE